MSDIDELNFDEGELKIIHKFMDYFMYSSGSDQYICEIPLFEALQYEYAYSSLCRKGILYLSFNTITEYSDSNFNFSVYASYPKGIKVLEMFKSYKEL